MASGASTPLRQMLEGPLAQLSSQVERLFEEARGRARREMAEQLNQAARRMRLADSIDEVGATLVDAACVFATGAALFRVEGETAFGERIRGVSDEAAWAFSELEIPLASAAALASAVGTRDPVTALASPTEVSAELSKLLEHSQEGRVQVFPVVVKENVPALLYAWGNVQGPVLELLVQVAAAEWEMPEPEPVGLPPVLELVTISGTGPTDAAEPSEEKLSDVEERARLRARRFARVQVAQMRLQDPAAVLAGRAQGDLYTALRSRIDAARVTFRESFCVPCPGMVDYLHTELVRTLAHDDAELLGKDYPGPMA